MATFTVTSTNLTLRNDQWRKIEYEIPNLVRSVDAVVDDNNEHVYLREAKSDPAKIYHYQVSSGKWQQPIWSTTTRWSMIHLNELILVGGFIDTTSQCTSDLFGVGSNDDGTLRPDKLFPKSDTCKSLPTMRCRATTLVYKCAKDKTSYIIVIGGEDENETFLKTVHIFEATAPNSSWCRGKDIPKALSCSSGSIANGYLYLLGGWYERDRATSSVYRCNVDKLIATRRIIIPFESEEPITEEIWKPLPDLPVQEATCTSFRHTLIVVGGVANKVPVHDIRFYNEHYERWEVIGYLSCRRFRCFAIGLLDKLIVIGGLKDDNKSEDTVEIYTH